MLKYHDLSCYIYFEDKDAILRHRGTICVKENLFIFLDEYEEISLIIPVEKVRYISASKI